MACYTLTKGMGVFLMMSRHQIYRYLAPHRALALAFSSPHLSLFLLPH